MTGGFRRLAGLFAGLALVATAAVAQTVAPVRPDDRTLGAADAPVILTAYVSTTCSHCAEWHTRDFPAFKARYVDTGKVRVVYRDLFTPPAQLALYGAAMARCAPAEKYDAAISALFAGQAALYAAGGGQADAIAWLRGAGQAGGLTPEQMGACMNDQAALDALTARNDQAATDGVRSTPSFLVNGRPMPAAAGHDLASFQAVIDPLLAGS
jgi:protein-disulfide isomerase